MFFKLLVQLSLCLSIFYNIGFNATGQEITWKKIDKGLCLTELTPVVKSYIGDDKITILKINPELYSFHLFSAKEKNETIRTADEWAKDKNLIAVVNAGMFKKDFQTSAGFMKDSDFVNNPVLNKDNAIFACNPVDNSVPVSQIIDRKCQDWNELKNKYHSFVQSIRMVDCNQKNRWTLQSKKWSMVILTADKEGNTLFIFTRSPYAVHIFINTLLNAPLNLYNAMYLEGGPEASFYLNHNNTRIEKMGSYETGFNENDLNNRFWKIPNVIGIRKK